MLCKAFMIDGEDFCYHDIGLVRQNYRSDWGRHVERNVVAGINPGFK